MQAGELRHVIDFQTPPTAPDGQGGVTGNWSTVLAGVRAHVKSETTFNPETPELGGVASHVKHAITIRFRTDVAIVPAMRVVWQSNGGNVLEVKAVHDLTNRRRWLTLDCVETA